MRNRRGFPLAEALEQNQQAASPVWRIIQDDASDVARSTNRTRSSTHELAGTKKVQSQAVKDRLREMSRRDDEGLELVTMPDGHQSIDLKGRFHHISSLVMAEDGTLVVSCGAYFDEEDTDE